MDELFTFDDLLEFSDEDSKPVPQGDFEHLILLVELGLGLRVRLFHVPVDESKHWLFLVDLLGAGVGCRATGLDDLELKKGIDFVLVHSELLVLVLFGPTSHRFLFISGRYRRLLYSIFTTPLWYILTWLTSFPAVW